MKTITQREKRACQQLTDARQVNVEMAVEHKHILGEAQAVQSDSLLRINGLEWENQKFMRDVLDSAVALKKAAAKEKQCAIEKELEEEILGVVPKHVYTAIKLVTKTYDVNIIGSFSAWTATRVAIEALSADDLQVAGAIQAAEGITYSGDSTTIRGIAHESRTINANMSDGSHTRFSLGVHSAVNHTAETQFNGLQDQIKELIETHNSSL
ncbi:hypothetical protein M422DRAFT_271375 [Sphaerobolus stellatus SS14]|uniref:Uncharacterized protein n=1 Tax=Sphaerobolus stellatus (strain SS14) TaxID=990650 RepID=A0A0C9UEN6_SPHS4|nr:hypothetical protein M422DRAFT_271375 [Sphaerobolus stellatus SS14]